MTVDEALNIAVIHTLSIKHGIAVSEAAEAASILAAEVRRLRSEIDSARDDLQSFVDDRNHWKTKAEAAQSVLQNLMSYLSVSSGRADIDPENAELRIRDGINMLVRPVLERADRAEKALKEEQEPVAFWLIGPDGKDNGGPYRGKPSDSAIDKARNMGCEPVLLYARPVPAAPAVAAPYVPFSDDDMAGVHQLAYELGGTDGGEYILDGEQLDQVIVRAASLFYKPAVAVPAVPDDETMERVCSAIADALGNAYDCTRAWSAWSYGTMDQDDFSLVREDDHRLQEIADAAISALLQSTGDKK